MAAKHVHVFLNKGKKVVVGDRKAKSKDNSIELSLATKEVRKLQQAGVVAHHVVLAKVMNMLIGQGFGRDYSQKIAEEAMNLMAYDSKAKDDDGALGPARDATNHLGEKEYSSFNGWKVACKAANSSVQFEGDKEICQAKPGVGEWDGEKGSVYAKKTGDAQKPYVSGGADSWDVLNGSGKVAKSFPKTPDGMKAAQKYLSDNFDTLSKDCAAKDADPQIENAVRAASSAIRDAKAKCQVLKQVLKDRDDKSQVDSAISFLDDAFGKITQEVLSAKGA